MPYDSLKSIQSLNFTEPKPIKNYTDLLRDHSLADRQYELLCKFVKQFQDDLDDEHEVCLQLTSFGQSITLQVTDFGYANPCMIMFYGYVNGQYCELIQHVSQLNFLLMSCPKAEPQKPPRRIGFAIGDE